MGTLKYSNKLRSCWWGQPMLWGLLLIPLSGLVSPRLMVAQEKVYLLYLPLALGIALLMVFDWRALPGIALGLLVRYYLRGKLEEGVIMTFLYLFCLSICWLGYRSQVNNHTTITLNQLLPNKLRLMWLVVLPAVIFILCLQLLVGLGLLPDALGMMSYGATSLRTLVNFQALLIGNLVLVHLFYLLLRTLKKFSFIRVLYRRICFEAEPSVTRVEVIVWFVIVIIMVATLCYRTDTLNNLLLTDYCLALLLPVMLYSAMRFGYQFNCLVWPIILLILFSNYSAFAQRTNMLHNLALISAMILVFTLCLFLLAAIHTRQRIVHELVKNASFKDPVIGLANLRALKRDLALSPRSTLGFLRITGLELLSRHYGMLLSTHFKQQLAAVLNVKVLATDEGVYHIPGYDMVIRLNGYDAKDKIAAVYSALQQFRMIWNGLPIHPPIGISYCGVLAEVAHLPVLLGELSALAENSLSSGKPESLRSAHGQIQDKVHHKVFLLHQVQQALDNNKFVLMAQPILGVRGDHYHEILIRLADDNGALISPLAFLPIVQEFGLAYQLDMWVLHNTLMFMAQAHEQLPSARFSINVFPSSLCRSNFVQEVRDALQHYHIEPYQLIFEVTESPLLQDIQLASLAIKELRALGCCVAVDDFGTGYASFERLNKLEFDMLKIDGSFVTNMLSDATNYQIVASICQIAQMKHLMIVAEYIENEQQYEALKDLGVDYMQGYFIGEPQLLSSLLP